MKWSQQGFQFISWKQFCSSDTPPPQSTSSGKREGFGRLHQAGRMGSWPTAANCLMTGLLLRVTVICERRMFSSLSLAANALQASAGG